MKINIKIKRLSWLTIIVPHLVMWMPLFSACAYEIGNPEQKSQKNEALHNVPHNNITDNDSAKKLDSGINQNQSGGLETTSAKKLNKEQALKKAMELLSHQSILTYCKNEKIGSNIVAQVNLYEAINWSKIAAHDDASFCAKEFDLLINAPQKPHEKCLDTFIAACINPKNYGQRFLQSLTKLEKNSENDASYMNKLIEKLTDKHALQLVDGIWGGRICATFLFRRKRMDNRLSSV
jgi:hypothetical protein